MTTLSTHVLLTSSGRPGAGIPVRLFRDGAVIAEQATDEDGRASLGEVGQGQHHLLFDTSSHSDFFPSVEIAFVVSDDRHHHVPLLLSPFSYSTYRGS